jgi:hypothetical protein
MVKIRERIKELKVGLEIRKSALDDELEKQPQIFNEVSELAVMAAARRDFLKEELARTDAELAGKHRRKFEKDAGKATESMVNAAVATDPAHKTAVEKHIQSKETADLAMALKESFHQRRYMLQELSGLFVANYFQSSSAGVAGNNVREYKASKSRDSMADARDRRKRE